MNLKLEFTLSDNYLNRQENESIESKESKIIFKGGDIGRSPKPNQVFDEFKFFSKDSNTEILILIISPLPNLDWKIIDKSDTPNNLDLYELTITNEDLK